MLRVLLVFSFIMPEAFFEKVSESRAEPARMCRNSFLQRRYACNGSTFFPLSVPSLPSYEYTCIRPLSPATFSAFSARSRSSPSLITRLRHSLRGKQELGHTTLDFLLIQIFGSTQLCYRYRLAPPILFSAALLPAFSFSSVPFSNCFPIL
jgi:hypothetical protein